MTTDALRPRLILGDARSAVELADETVSLVATSPPYWTLKDYGPAGQVGFGQTVEAYAEALEQVFREAARVLRPGCRLCVNIGDQFLRAETHGRYRVAPLHAEIILRVERLGLDFMGSIIWRKVTTTHTSGGAAIMGSFPFPRNGVAKLDYEYILLFKKPGSSPPPSPEAKEAARMTIEEWNTYFAGHWTFPGEKSKSHLAPFPLELPRRLVRMFTFPGELVLDPFCGSGTTLVAAHALGRRGVGYDLDPTCVSYVRARFADAGEDADLEVVRREGASGVAAAEGEEPAATEETGELFFGSVVRAADRGKKRFAGRRTRAARVVGPTAFVTTDKLRVSLLGVIPKPGVEDAAAERLDALLGRKRLHLTNAEGADVSDVDGAAYVHLDDRTFVNGRMIREGLLLPDPAVSHPHAARFAKWAGAAP